MVKLVRTSWQCFKTKPQPQSPLQSEEPMNVETEKSDDPPSTSSLKPKEEDERKERQIEKPKLGEDLTKTYRSVQIKKLIAHIERSNGSEGIMALPNLDDLIKLALSNSKKTLRNEEQFFTFLFENNMSHFVKNRSKIDLYYRGGPWYQV